MAAMRYQNGMLTLSGLDLLVRTNVQKLHLRNPHHHLWADIGRQGNHTKR